MAKITIVGTGYVGLVSGAGFSHLGHDVTCVDVVEEKIQTLNEGGLPIYEEGLGKLIREGVDAGRLRFQVGHTPESLANEFHYLCVPTPEGEDGSADVSYLQAAAAEIGPGLAPNSMVVNKSTVPVGSASLVEDIIGRSDVHVVSNPEFLREGTAVADFMKPDRVVIGASDTSAAKRVAALYDSLDADIVLTDCASAELVKYASNAFLAMKLSFVNTIASVCEGLGADIDDVRLGMGSDSRIGMDFLRPGPGWGGSCFPKDTRAMLQIAADAGYPAKLVQAAMDVNEDQFDRVVKKVAAACDDGLTDAHIAVLGIAFKAGTDDTRMSPSLEVIERLVAGGAKVTAFDPVATADVDGLTQSSDAYTTCVDADVVVIMTEWPEFGSLDFEKIAESMRGTTVIDTRSVVEAAHLADTELDLVAIGKTPFYG